MTDFNQPDLSDVAVAAAAAAAAAGAGAEAADASAAGAGPAENGKPPKKKRPVWQRICIVVAIVVVVAIAAYGIWIVAARVFMASETEIRTAWKADTGELVGTNDYDVNIYEAAVESDLAVLQIEPVEVEDEGFTYYDVDVQERLASTVAELQDGDGTSWEAESPLAILNPYGTGSNGLYLYFETDWATEVSYTITTEGYDDYSATASGGYTTTHEVQIIGLVPGETNHVTITLTGEWGNVRQTIEFDITMPETTSGYPTTISYEDGESTAELSDGLYVLLRTYGYLGYGFFFDNSGTLRYEMVLEGFGLDRIVEYNNEIVVCVSDSKIARINGLGQVTAVYDMGEYVLHHDINDAEEGKLIIAAEYAESDENLKEDLVLELDLETGELTLLLDFSELMEDYRTEYSRVIGLTDYMAYEAGQWDWIHINSVQYLSDDSIIVSSRETSTIIKVSNVHSDPEAEWMCGNAAFWDGTSYEDLCLEAVGDFTFQYGQHTVEYAGAGEEDGVYYLRMFDNNFWALSTRDDYEISDEDLEGVGTALYDFTDEVSYVRVYKIDENAGTFECVLSFEVPYSSIVSSAAPSDVWLSYRLENEDELYDMTGKTWIVNSGTAMVFGEYDEEGTLIRQFSYNGYLQGYRVIKYTLEGFWFAE